MGCCPREQMQTTWVSGQHPVPSALWGLPVTSLTWPCPLGDHVHHGESSALICCVFLAVENLCLGLSLPLLAFHSVIVATIACLVGAPAKVRDTTLDLVSLNSVHSFFTYFLMELRGPFKPRSSEELGFLFPFVNLSFNLYAYVCRAK